VRRKREREGGVSLIGVNFWSLTAMFSMGREESRLGTRKGGEAFCSLVKKIKKASICPQEGEALYLSMVVQRGSSSFYIN